MGYFSSASLPWIGVHLLEAEGYPLLLSVKFQDLDRYLITDSIQLGRVTYSAPGHVRDVKQTDDSAQVDKEAVILDIRDYPLENRVLFEEY